MSNCYRYTKHTALSYDAIGHSRVTITTQAPQQVHTRIIISILYTRFIHQAACGEQRFSQTLVQAPVIRIPPSYHVQKGNEVPMWLWRIQLKASGRESVAERSFFVAGYPSQ